MDPRYPFPLKTAFRDICNKTNLLSASVGIATDSNASTGNATHKGFFRATATDADGSGLLQEVEVFFLELETFNAAL